jgi:hypothetical protein
VISTFFIALPSLSRLKCSDGVAGSAIRARGGTIADPSRRTPVNSRFPAHGGRSGIDPQPGRQPALAAYRIPDELVREPSAVA